MVKIRLKTRDLGCSKESFILFLIVVGAVVFGIVCFYFLHKYSVRNRYICKYLGGLWERKESDLEHRCYTYEEFYK